MAGWSPPSYDVKIIGGKKVIIWPENQQKKQVFIPPMVRSVIGVYSFLSCSC